jgi:hypothetical protein
MITMITRFTCNVIAEFFINITAESSIPQTHYLTG